LNDIIRNIKKLGCTVILLLISLLAYSQAEMQDFERLNYEKVVADLDTIKMEMDSTVYYINSIYQLLKEQHKIIGWRKTIHILIDTFLPILIFAGLYILWLKNRN